MNDFVNNFKSTFIKYDEYTQQSISNQIITFLRNYIIDKIKTEIKILINGKVDYFNKLNYSPNIRNSYKVDYVDNIDNIDITIDNNEEENLYMTIKIVFNNNKSNPISYLFEFLMDPIKESEYDAKEKTCIYSGDRSYDDKHYDKFAEMISSELEENCTEWIDKYNNFI